MLLRKYGGVAGRKEARAMVFCQVGWFRRFFLAAVKPEYHDSVIVSLIDLMNLVLSFQTKVECAELATSPLLSFPRQMLSGDVPQEG